MAKKMTRIIPVAGIAAMLIACASTGSATNKEFVKFTNETRKTVPKGVIVGFGQASAQGFTPTLAYQTAITRARDDIARQMGVLIMSSFIDYSAGSEGDPHSSVTYQEQIIVSLSKQKLDGSKVFKETTDESGQNYFVAVIYDVNDAKKLAAAEINKSELAKNKNAANTAIADMNAAFDREFN